MEKNLVTVSDSSQADTLIVSYSNGEIKPKTAFYRVLVLHSTEDQNYYIVLLDLGQIANGRTLEEAKETALAIIQLIKEDENKGYKKPNLGKHFEDEYQRLLKTRNPIDKSPDGTIIFTWQ